MNERRHESRFLCADLVKVEWVASTSSGGVHTAEAVLEDISAFGACFQVDDPIPFGSPVLISTHGEERAQLAGQVSYCVYRDYGYFVGMKFAEDTPWSSGVFEPRYLTSLEALAGGRAD